MQNNVSREAGKLPGLKRERGLGLRLMVRWEYWVMLLPGLVMLLINNYIPMLGIVIAFKKYSNHGNYFLNIIKSGLPFYDGKPNLFANFMFLFKGPAAGIITRNTVLYNIAFITVGLVLAVAFAILLSELRNRKASRVYQSAMFLPYFLSWVVVGYLVYALCGTEYGFFNAAVLKPLGLQPVKWYFTMWPWPFMLVFFNMWKYTGYNCVVYLAAITAIDTEYYEAATIDGATRWQQIKHITLPLLQPLMIIMTTLAIGRIFNADFGLFFHLPRSMGSLYDVTEVVDTFVFKALRNNNNIGMSSAAGLYQAVVGCVFVFTANMIVRRIDRDKALF